MKKIDGYINENIEVINDRAVEISQDGRLKVVCRNTTLEVDGVFVIKDSISPAHLVPGLEIDGIHIKNNKSLETNIPGLFVAGDCAGKPYKYMKSAGEGQIAVNSALSYIDKLNNK